MKRYTTKSALIVAAKKVFANPSISDYGNSVWIFEGYNLVGHFDEFCKSGALAFTQSDSATLEWEVRLGH